MATDDKIRGCRRKNYVHSAYVEAAIDVNTTFASDRAYWLLIRENVPPPVIERVLQVPRGRVRRKWRQYVDGGTAGSGFASAPTVADRRADHLTSQRVTVALVFQTMLGNDAAVEYLRDAGVPVWTITRVLGSTQRRQSPELLDVYEARGPYSVATRPAANCEVPEVGPMSDPSSGRQGWRVSDPQ